MNNDSHFTRTILLATFFATTLACAKPSATELIVGGKNVDGQDPISHSVIALYEQDGEGGASLCSATLIGRNFALTAAHCVDAGTEGMIGIFGSDIRSKSAMKLPILRAVVSPAWQMGQQNPSLDGSQDQDQGDIAVIEFDGKLPQGFRPVPILAKRTKLEAGAEVEIAGFGISDADKRNGEGVLRKATVTIAEPDFGDTEILFDQTQGQGACHGDSGGPAFIEKNGKIYLMGVTNRAFPEAAPDDCAHQVVYTKAQAYKTWIQETIKSLKSDSKTEQ